MSKRFNNNYHNVSPNGRENWNEARKNGHQQQGGQQQQAPQHSGGGYYSKYHNKKYKNNNSTFHQQQQNNNKAVADEQQAAIGKDQTNAQVPNETCSHNTATNQGVVSQTAVNTSSQTAFVPSFDCNGSSADDSALLPSRSTSNTPVGDEITTADQQQHQAHPIQSQQMSCDYGNVVYTEYDYATGTVPVMQQASPSSYYIYHSPAATSAGMASPEPYFQCAPYMQPQAQQQTQSYLSYEQHNQMAFLSQTTATTSAPAAMPNILASPQHQPSMLSALSQSSYHTPPQSTQFGLATGTPDQSSPNQMISAAPNAYPYMMPYPTPGYHPYGSPNASYMLYSPQSPVQAAPQQQPTMTTYQTPQTPPSNPSSMDNRGNSSNHRPYRYSNNRYNRRYNNHNNYPVETTPTKSNLNETIKSPLSCITSEESMLNYHYMSSPTPVPMASGLYSPGPALPTGVYSPDPYCCSPLDSSYYQQAPASGTLSPYSGYAMNPFYPGQADFDMSTSCLATPSEYAESVVQNDEHDANGKGGDDEDETGGEQLACYTCRGRRMCFCYFLKVRYYKFPSFLDLVDHQYKKWRSNLAKTRKVAAPNGHSAIAQ